MADAEREALLTAWVDRYSDSLLRMCFISLRDWALAEDALQETFIKAWRAMPQKFYGPELPLPSWLPERFSVITYEIFVSEELRSCTILHVSDDGTLIYQVTDYFDPTSAYSYIEQDGEGEYVTLPDGRVIYVTTNVQYYTATWSTDREHIVLSGAITREEAIRMAESVRIP